MFHKAYYGAPEPARATTFCPIASYSIHCSNLAGRCLRYEWLWAGPTSWFRNRSSYCMKGIWAKTPWLWFLSALAKAVNPGKPQNCTATQSAWVLSHPESQMENIQEVLLGLARIRLLYPSSYRTLSIQAVGKYHLNNRDVQLSFICTLPNGFMQILDNNGERELSPEYPAVLEGKVQCPNWKLLRRKKYCKTQQLIPNALILFKYHQWYQRLLKDQGRKLGYDSLRTRCKPSYQWPLVGYLEVVWIQRIFKSRESTEAVGQYWWTNRTSSCLGSVSLFGPIVF